jgi:hypothetical protein
VCDDIRESKAFRDGVMTREQALDEIEDRASGANGDPAGLAVMDRRTESPHEAKADA